MGHGKEETPEEEGASFRRKGTSASTGRAASSCPSVMDGSQMAGNCWVLKRCFRCCAAEAQCCVRDANCQSSAKGGGEGEVTVEQIPPQHCRGKGNKWAPAAGRGNGGIEPNREIVLMTPKGHDSKWMIDVQNLQHFQYEAPAHCGCSPHRPQSCAWAGTQIPASEQVPTHSAAQGADAPQAVLLPGHGPSLGPSTARYGIGISQELLMTLHTETGFTRAEPPSSSKANVCRVIGQGEGSTEMIASADQAAGSSHCTQL